MTKAITLFVVFIAIFSCKNLEEKEVESTTTIKTIEPRNIKKSLIFENRLINNNIEGAQYNNIEFTADGALFKGDTLTPSFITLPFTKLNLSNPFNISFSYETFLEDGSKPQTFFAFASRYSSPSKLIPLYIYSAGKRLTGVYGGKKLWAENYDNTLGESKKYYDSYQLSNNEIFFVSLNFTGLKIDIYVNSELYATFPNLEPHLLEYSKVVIGALPTVEGYTTLFNGRIHGVKIFNKALTEKEIVEIYNGQP